MKTSWTGSPPLRSLVRVACYVSMAHGLSLHPIQTPSKPSSMLASTSLCVFLLIHSHVLTSRVQERNLKKHSDKIKMRAEDLLKRTKTPTGELIAKDLEREIDRFKAKVYDPSLRL